MATQVHDIGEELQVKVLSGEVTLPTTVDIGLYHDGEVSGDTTAGDDLASGDDIDAITTEPDAGTTAYERYTVSLDGSTSWNLSLDGNSDFEMELIEDANFDLSDVGAPDTIDAYFVVVNWDDGSGAGDHIWWTDNLDTDYDVGSVDNFDLENASLAHSGQTAP